MKKSIFCDFGPKNRVFGGVSKNALFCTFLHIFAPPHFLPDFGSFFKIWVSKSALFCTFLHIFAHPKKVHFFAYFCIFYPPGGGVFGALIAEYGILVENRGFLGYF